MGDRKRDENSGRFSEEYPREDFLRVLEEHGAAGTTDVAEHVGCDRRTAYLKLQSLEEEGDVESRKVGNALLWELVDKP
ncbi:helix-turn-helix domain-containing protein [Halorubrum sp. Atlit-26R]|uniref:helix-turn-helix domain-containing protein n=1 Tax=Halorubrum sp. Atlit-26R TaxID=2282128 RepID=UPI000EF284EC|nr:helix-turn-helix domain-containing protein [Halorubrum sp. Atlit-26R]RLM62347.1 transcriptional regulator [Halorubrum sp. Atlit-26R]